MPNRPAKTRRQAPRTLPPPEVATRRILVVAPHPDDETFGCGGTLLRHRDRGDTLHWLIVTTARGFAGVTPAQVKQREREVEVVARELGFASVHRTMFPTTRLDTIPMADLIGAVGSIFTAIRPQVVYLPWRGDAHTDHRIVFDAATACTKWFRYPGIERVLAYETPSETDFGLRPDLAFRPNVFVDISPFLEEKLRLLAVYASEMGVFPFPRSAESVRAMAAVRGAAAGHAAAEAFVLLKEIW